MWDADLALDGAKVTVAPRAPRRAHQRLPRRDGRRRRSPTCRDHQQPVDGSHAVSDAVLELCDGVDLLIHDAQYTADEFAGEGHLGPLHRRLRRARRPGGRRPAPGAVPPRPRPTTTTPSTRSSPTPVALRRGHGASTRCVAAHEGLVVSFG